MFPKSSNILMKFPSEPLAAEAMDVLNAKFADHKDDNDVKVRLFFLDEYKYLPYDVSNHLNVSEQELTGMYLILIDISIYVAIHVVIIY